MDGIFALSAEKTRWLGVRQSRVAENIANVNTPGYKSRDVVPFREVLNGAATALQTTDKNHFRSAPLSTLQTRGTVNEGGQVISGNSVDLDGELLKLSENMRSHAMATGVTRVFHRMYLVSIRSA
jgi:flagellar basal-body rod protein FlgB